jgi:hypothetical protein
LVLIFTHIGIFITIFIITIVGYATVTRYMITDMCYTCVYRTEFSGDRFAIGIIFTLFAVTGNTIPTYRTISIVTTSVCR